MSTKNNMKSDLKDHKYNKGLIQTPFNTIPNTQPVSWIKERLPEYLWLGLILMDYERTKGIEKAGEILKTISKIDSSIVKPKLSIILSLPTTKQNKIYKIICDKVNPRILAPLTVLYRNSDYPIFNQYFNFPEIHLNDRVDLLSEAIKLYYDHQSDESTDLRFIVLSMIIFQEKLRITRDSPLIEVFTNYPYTNHEDEKMKMYRPSIRALEMADIENIENHDFSKMFWKQIGIKTNCEPIILSFLEEEEVQMIDYKQFIVEFQQKLHYLLEKEKENSLTNDKFHVIVGSTTYSLKIFNDVIEKRLDDSILGRHAFRTILETYINIKYLLLIESQKQNIWEEYKLYGIGKYKRPLLIARENEEMNKNSHFIEPIIDMIVNEVVWEEFVDIDTRYFDKTNIKTKFEQLGEQILYDIYYEYDNNFIHGFWSAIRESSMLHCNNVAHQYHAVPDLNFQQKMSSVKYDIYKIMNKFSILLDEAFPS